MKNLKTSTMRHLNRFNENWIPDESRLAKDFTDADKKFFDLVFAEFIDMGATSELYQSEIKHFESGMGGNSYTQKVKRYRIYVNLVNMVSKGRPMGSRLIDLVKYTESLNELLLELYSCISKIKEEDDYKYVGTHIHTNKDSKVRLKYEGYDEGEVPDRFNIVLNLYK